MAWAVDQSTLGTNQNGGNATTIALTTTNAVAAGGTIFLVVGNFNAAVDLTSVAGGGLTWTVEAKANNGGVRAALAKAEAPSGLASGSTITATYSGSTSERKIGAASFTGGAGTTEDPQTNTGSGTGWSLTPSPLGGTSLVVAAASLDTNSNSTPDANSTELLDFAVGTSSISVLYYRIGGAVGGTWGAAAGWAAAGGSFEAAGGGGGAPTPRQLATLGAGT